MNSNDAKIADLYTTATGGLVEDDAPNAGPPRAAGFDLILQAEAGSTIGNSGATYTLSITAVDENSGGAVPGLNPTGTPFAEAFNPASGWGASAGDFIKTQDPTAGAGTAGIVRYAITIPAGVTGRFHYNVEMLATNFQVVSIGQSNTFVLV
jgi:hypothetical protein